MPGVRKMNQPMQQHKTFVYHLYNVGPTSLPLAQRCTNVLCLLGKQTCEGQGKRVLSQARSSQTDRPPPPPPTDPAMSDQALVLLPADQKGRPARTLMFIYSLVLVTVHQRNICAGHAAYPCVSDPMLKCSTAWRRESRARFATSRGRTLKCGKSHVHNYAVENGHPCRLFCGQ